MLTFSNCFKNAIRSGHSCVLSKDERHFSTCCENFLYLGSVWIVKSSATSKYISTPVFKFALQVKLTWITLFPQFGRRSFAKDAAWAMAAFRFRHNEQWTGFFYPIYASSMLLGSQWRCKCVLAAVEVRCQGRPRSRIDVARSRGQTYCSRLATSRTLCTDPMRLTKKKKYYSILSELSRKEKQKYNTKHWHNIH